MTIKSIIKFLFVMSMILFYSTSFADKKPVNPSDDFYSEDKLNISVDAMHPEFTIKLKSNPTTGYSWFLREYDANLLTPLKHKFAKPSQKLIGAPGYELWTFHVKPSGFIVPQLTTIRMVYTRPWQGMESSTQLVFRVSTLSGEK